MNESTASSTVKEKRHFVVIQNGITNQQILDDAIKNSLGEDWSYLHDAFGSVEISSKNNEEKVYFSQANPIYLASSVEVEIIGNSIPAAKFARAYATAVDGEMFESTALINNLAWLERPEIKLHPTLSMIELRPALMRWTPWLNSMWRRAVENKQRLILRTPSFTQATPVIKQIIKSGFIKWLVETDKGLVDGLNQVKYHVDEEGLLQPDSSHPDPFDYSQTIKENQLFFAATVLTPVDLASSAGEFSEKVIKLFSGEDALSNTGVGWSELSLIGFKRQGLVDIAKEKSPNTTAFCVRNRFFSGGISFRPSPQGIVEEVNFELKNSEYDPKKIWDAISDFHPLSFLVQTVDSISALTHESFKTDAATPNGPVEAGISVPGYRGMIFTEVNNLDPKTEQDNSSN